MEVDRAPADALHRMQPPPRVPGVMGGGRSSVGTSSLLSAAVQELLMVQKSNNAIKKPPRATLRLPPVIGGGRTGEMGNGPEPAIERAPRASSLSSPRSRQPPAKRVARSMLRRSAPPPADEKRKVLTCCCARLPPGLRCSLHQCAPGRSWMRSQCAGGGIAACEAVAPQACGRGRWMFSEYARWRRSVWMPSRFYLEGVDRQPLEPAIELNAGRWPPAS